MKLIAVTAILLMLTTATVGQEAQLTCRYDGGKLTRPCRHILRQAAKQLKKHPLAKVRVINGDDSVGEYLVGLGVNWTRISETAGDGKVLKLELFQSCICEKHDRK